VTVRLPVEVLTLGDLKKPKINARRWPLGKEFFWQTEFPISPETENSWERE